MVRPSKGEYNLKYMYKEIIDNIINNQNEILSKIDKESISVYLYLKKEYEKGSIKDNKVFQFVFRSFYRLDNAGLSDELKTHYFKLLSNKNIKLEKILLELYDFKTLRGYNAVQFSFATKLLHTIDNRLPIFDAEASRVLKIRVSGSGKEKIKSCLTAYKKMKQTYLVLLEDKKILILINKFRNKFKLKDKDITNEKILDFIIWSLGKVISK